MINYSLSSDTLHRAGVLLNAFFGAGLGAAFYTLLKTQPYLADRSFDPKYNAAYLNRFMTGLIAGLILAVALYSALKTQIEAQAGAYALGPGILAILGGFASEAVEKILQRLTEVLLALVQGDGSEQAKAKVLAEASQNNVEVRNKLIDLEKAQTDPKRFAQVMADLHNTLKMSGG